MNKIYIVTNVLPLKYGGRTKSLFQRANMLSELDYDVEILFTGMDYDFSLKFAKLKHEGKVNPQVKLTSMIEDLRKDTELYTYRYQADVNYGDNFDSAHYHEINESLSEVRFYAPMTKKLILRDFISPDGTLLRRNYYETIKKATKAKLFNPDGSIMANLEYEDINKKNTITNVDYCDGKYPAKSFKTFGGLKSYWINNYIADPKAIILVDARTDDRPVINAKLSNRKIFVMHSNHYSVKMKEVKKNWRFLLSQEPSSDIEFLTLTNEQRQDIMKLDEFYKGVKINVLGHPIDPYETTDQIDDKRFVIVSRMDDNKNLLDAVRAFQIFSQKNPEYYLDIYGEGDNKIILESYIEMFKLHNVHIKGYTNSPRNEFAKSIGTITTSFYEGFGMSMGEAIASGCKVASYPFKYGQEDLLNPGHTGFISQERNITSLAQELENLVNHPVDRNEIRQSISAYTTENIKKQWKELLK